MARARSDRAGPESTNRTSRQGATFDACIQDLDTGRCQASYAGTTDVPRGAILFGNEPQKHRLGPCGLLLVVPMEGDCACCDRGCSGSVLLGAERAT